MAPRLRDEAPSPSRTGPGTRPCGRPATWWAQTPSTRAIGVLRAELEPSITHDWRDTHGASAGLTGFPRASFTGRQLALDVLGGPGNGPDMTKVRYELDVTKVETFY